MSAKWKLGDRVRISCDKETGSDEQRRFRDDRAVGVVRSVPPDDLPDFYYVGFNGGDERATWLFRGKDLLPESEDGACAEMIPVMRWSMEGLPDLYVRSADDLGRTLRDTFLGDAGEWEDMVGSKSLTCHFERMSRREYESLEAWEA